jgi:hypothetical protein
MIPHGIIITAIIIIIIILVYGLSRWRCRPGAVCVCVCVCMSVRLRRGAQTNAQTHSVAGKRVEAATEKRANQTTQTTLIPADVHCRCSWLSLSVRLSVRPLASPLAARPIQACFVFHRKPYGRGHRAADSLGADFPLVVISAPVAGWLAGCKPDSSPPCGPYFVSGRILCAALAGASRWRARYLLTNWPPD